MYNRKSNDRKHTTQTFTILPEIRIVAQRDRNDTILPREYSGLHRAILCKDCLAHTTAPFHIVGMKCQACGGYNTSIDAGPLLVGEGEGWRPLTEQEEKALEGAHFPPPPTAGEGEGVEEGEEEEEDGGETTEEEMVEEELD